MTEQGTLTSLDGWWTITWDHAHTGQATYEVFDEDDGSEYVARYDDGWRVAPKGHATVDLERLISLDDPELHPLLDALNRASGRVDEGSVYRTLRAGKS